MNTTTGCVLWKSGRISDVTKPVMKMQGNQGRCILLEMLDSWLLVNRWVFSMLWYAKKLKFYCSCTTQKYLITVHIYKRSHSIHMLSIQIDTKSLELVNNIKLSLFASHMKSSVPLFTFDRCCTVIGYSRVCTILIDIFLLGDLLLFRRTQWTGFMETLTKATAVHFLPIIR